MLENNNIGNENEIPLVVDLDGTFIDTDMLYEAVKELLKKNILYIFLCLWWLRKGKVNLKNEIFSIIHIKVESLPYNKEVLKFLNSEYEKGTKLVLATASLKRTALEIANLYPFFYEVYGTENDINLKGINKLNVLIQRYGQKKFDYIGNSYSDLIIFSSSRYAYLVNPTNSVKRKLKRISNLKYTWSTLK